MIAFPTRLPNARMMYTVPEGPQIVSVLELRLNQALIGEKTSTDALNAMAVEMCKLSLWLVSLDKSKPFSFVDDKIFCGNSLLVSRSIELRGRDLLVCTAILNSFCADWMLRNKVTANVNMFLSTAT